MDFYETRRRLANAQKLKLAAKLIEEVREEHREYQAIQKVDTRTVRLTAESLEDDVYQEVFRGK